MSGTILIADDHPLYRQALVMAAASVRPYAKLIECSTLPQALSQAQAHEDLILIVLDLKMPGAEGFSGLALIHCERPQVPIVVVSSEDPDHALINTLRFGAVSFLSKNSELPQIEQALTDALDGKRMNPPKDVILDPVAAKLTSLTPTQLKVLLGVMKGLLNKQIAYELGISEATVKAHMTAILKKLEVGNRTQAVLAARALGLKAQAEN
jgi:DNA-binding NarL/FixJ family response regulator